MPLKSSGIRSNLYVLFQFSHNLNCNVDAQTNLNCIFNFGNDFPPTFRGPVLLNPKLQTLNCYSGFGFWEIFDRLCSF